MQFTFTEVQALYNTKIKKYDGFHKATVFSRPIYNPDKLEEKNRVKVRRNYKKNQKNDSREDNLKRTKEKIYDIALANNFEYFVTITLDKEKIDRYDRQVILKKLKVWLDNKARRNDLKYILIPEEHKDGAVHFHGLMSGDLKMKDSGKKTNRGQVIYNIGAWKYGFSTAVKLEGPYQRIVNYIMKYITKEGQKKIFGKHYFAGGKGLKREVEAEYKNVNYKSVIAKEYIIPEAFLAVKYMTYDISNVSRETLI